MTGRDETDSGGDYEYDLAHEEVSGPEAREPEQPAVPEPRMPEDEAGGDYSYDLAHDIPPAGS